MEKNSENLLLSIITVVRNDVVRLLRTFDSVSKNKGILTEYIVIDGNSTDGTKELIGLNNGLVDFSISEPDQGIYDAMNKGISASKGRYLVFINAGDELLINLEGVLGSLGEEVVIAYGKANRIGTNGILRRIRGKKILKISRFLKGMPVCHQAVIYKRSVIKKYDLRFKVISDRVLTYQLFKEYGLNRTLFLDKILVNYYDGGFSDKAPLLSVLEEQEKFYKDMFLYHWIIKKRVSYYFKVLVKKPIIALFCKKNDRSLLRKY